MTARPTGHDPYHVYNAQRKERRPKGATSPGPYWKSEGRSHFNIQTTTMCEISLPAPLIIDLMQPSLWYDSAGHRAMQTQLLPMPCNAHGSLCVDLLFLDSPDRSQPRTPTRVEC